MKCPTSKRHQQPITVQSPTPFVKAEYNHTQSIPPQERHNKDVDAESCDSDETMALLLCQGPYREKNQRDPAS